MGAISPRGDLAKGIAIATLINYERLVGDAAASPLVKTRGSANQLIAAVGLGYTF
jgi:outer membrane scaffolding protein for murein synthesis (MipA/OmpV family)